MKTDKPKKEDIKRQKQEKMRSFRVAEQFDYPYILQSCPVEIAEGYIIADRETTDVFAEFIFKNLAEKPLVCLVINLAFYYHQNIPFTRIEFEYSHEHLYFGEISKNGTSIGLHKSNRRKAVLSGECFGERVYIKLPESRYTKMTLTIVSAEFADGETQVLNIPITGDGVLLTELNDIEKQVYDEKNCFEDAEKLFPTKNLPQFGSTGWLCCCGNKNPSSAAKCEKCSREKKVLESTLSKSALSDAHKVIIADPKRIAFHDKTRFSQNKFLETEAERIAKAKMSERAIANVEREMQRKERKKLSLLPNLFVFALITLALAVLIGLIPVFISGDEFSIWMIFEILFNILTS